jgi:ketosteroid isomerase-like protein
MSQENVENLREFLESWDPKADLEAWRRGETGGLSLFDPDLAYEDTILPDHGAETYHGYEGVVRATTRWLEPFETLTHDLERIIGSGDRLVSVHRVQMKARHTGIELEGPLAYLWTFRDGKVIHLKSYGDPAEALEAAGLSD